MTMVDDETLSGGALPDPPTSSDPIESVNRPDPVQRRDTRSSKAGSESGFERAADTCRICRSEGTPEEPLFYPCKCSGSIKYVHDDCLMEWLSHSHKKHCELCKTPFRFTKLYDANMPPQLPWAVFGRRAAWHLVQLAVRAARACLVALVWLGIMPWLIRRMWRWYFWVADAAWAREAFMRLMRAQAEQEPHANPQTPTFVQWAASALQQLIHRPSVSPNPEEQPLGYSLTNAFAKNLGLATEPAPLPPSSSTSTWPQPDPSILSSWTYVSSLTSSDLLNRAILDVIEGQIITCVVITGFILVFLIREWVVQQQPLVNLDQMGNNAQQQQQLREAAERARADDERWRRQQDLLEQARRRLIELQNEAGIPSVTEAEVDEKVDFIGWEALEPAIDQATEHLRREGDGGYMQFVSAAEEVTKQIRAAGGAGVELEDFTNKVHHKLASYGQGERKQWERVLASAIESSTISNGAAVATASSVEGSFGDDAQQATESIDTSKRPRMPDREFSSRATNIKRLLEEADAVFKTSSNSSPELALPVDTNEKLPEDSSADDINARDISENSARLFWPTIDPVPITNAGPDAKVNITRSGKGKMKAASVPKINEQMLEDDEKKKKLEDEVTKELEEEMKRSSRSTSDEIPAQDDQRRENTNNPFHPDGPEPERRNSESFSNRVASAFREEFGLDEAEELENLRQPGVQPNVETTPSSDATDEPPHEPPADAAPGYFQRLTNWFWGDIRPRDAPEPVPAPNEELEVDGDNEAPFVPILDRRPPIAEIPPPRPAAPQQPHHDPEVVAAAQQAGLDPEAIEDAEDLEGIFELIGLQGPLIGLFQTSAFCGLLVACTILGAVVLPYAGGKLVLNIVGSPVYTLVKMPLQVASFAADLVIDVALMLGGWLVMLLALAADYLLSAAEAWMPSLGGGGGGGSVAESIMDYATNTASNAGTRLSSLLLSDEPVQGPMIEILAVSWALLASSVHAHASLRTIQDEVNAILSCMGSAVTFTVETISTGSVPAVCKSAFLAATNVSNIRAAVKTGANLIQEYMQPFLASVRDLYKGTVTVSRPRIVLDPSLVYWNSTDRTFAILAGYAALAALATVYVALDRSITKTESGKKTEKMIRDTLRQAGGVLKVILIISIEMLVFPLYCGLLLDIAFLPLFQNATVASRWAFAGRSPYTFCFVHWFVGTCYMFHFALFVGMCRKILRKGVLWFIRDPDDPTFHPVRDVLERNVATQLRKIAFSALVYGALVILCLGGVIWTIGQVFEDIFPIYWISTEPILEFPLDLFLYNFITPLVIRLFKPSDTVNAMYAWWLRRCARVLRLSHFLFDDRRKDEEGHLVRQSWTSLLFMKKPETSDVPPTESQHTYTTDTQPDVYFERDGKYVLTPCNDQYRPPKPGEAFLHVDDNDVYIADQDGKRNEHFAKVYVPPLFRVRITLFMVCLWMFSAFTGLCVTLVPLVFGRNMFALFLPSGFRTNDIYAYSLGAYVLCGLSFAVWKGGHGALYLKNQATKVDFHTWIEPSKQFLVRALKCLYVYGFIGVVLPCIFALLLQFYFILPLHTAFTGSDGPPTTTVESTTGNVTWGDSIGILTEEVTYTKPSQLPTLAEHSIHVLQDYALGLLYVRIASRLVISAPASRAAEAFRRITADGYLNPNAKLATRFFILPVTLITALVLLVPPLTATAAIRALEKFAPSLTPDHQWAVKLYRYSYPLASTCGVIALTVAELGKATSRWRNRIRDEVYLRGERLHNFGEKKPPPGSKSVVRKER